MSGIVRMMKSLLGTVGLLEGCAHSVTPPKWVIQVPKDHYVGVSGCIEPGTYSVNMFVNGELEEITGEETQEMVLSSARVQAFGEAILDKCNLQSTLIPPWAKKSPVQESVQQCRGGLIVFGLFRSEDLDCSELLQGY